MGCGIGKGTSATVVSPVPAGRPTVTPTGSRPTSVPSFGSPPASSSRGQPSNALVPVIRPTITVGDTVKIIEDVAVLRRLQNGHGGYKDEMLSALGKIGKVVRVDADGDLKVEVEGRQWLLHPDCCTLVPTSERRPHAQSSGSNDGESSDDEDDEIAARVAGRLAIILILTAGSPIDPSRLVSEAAQGHVDNVQAILNRFPNSVNRKQQGVTALQAAANQGHANVVGMLLAAGADPTIADDDGDNTFHYAAYGNKPGILLGLLGVSPSSINAVNNAGQTPLHVAVIKQSEGCVLVILKQECDVNIQDADGDTALHEAVRRINLAIVVMLTATKAIDLKRKNSKGFNVIHLSAQCGNQNAVTLLLDKAPAGLVNEPASVDGCTALHFAAAKGYPITATILIEKGKANLEAKASNGSTPLLIAVCNGQIPLIELLVIKGAKLEAEDEDGDSVLHNVLFIWRNSLQQPTDFVAFLLKSILIVQPKDIQQSTNIYQIFLQLGGNSVSVAWIAVACFLISRGANLHHKNKAGRTPLDEVDSPQIKNLLLSVKVH